MPDAWSCLRGRRCLFLTCACVARGHAGSLLSSAHPPGRQDREDLFIRGVVLLDPFVADEPVRLESGELGIDLTVARVPEGSDALPELGGDVIARARAAREESEEREAERAGHYVYID